MNKRPCRDSISHHQPEPIQGLPCCETEEDTIVYAATTDPETGETIYLQNFIMEKALGRKLEPDEVVCFRNGNTLDCRNSNLFVVKVDPEAKP